MMASPSLLWPPFITGATWSGVPTGTIGIRDGDTALIIDGDELCKSWLMGEELLMLMAAAGTFGL